MEISVNVALKFIKNSPCVFAGIHTWNEKLTSQKNKKELRKGEIYSQLFPKKMKILNSLIPLQLDVSC